MKLASISPSSSSSSLLLFVTLELLLGEGFVDEVGADAVVLVLLPIFFNARSRSSSFFFFISESNEDKVFSTPRRNI